MSEPEKEGRRPPTIELKATEVGDGQAPNPPHPSAASPGDEATTVRDRGASGGLKTFTLGALGGAAVMAAIGAAAWFAGLAPAQQAPAPPASQSQTETPRNDEVAARLDKIEAAIKGQQPTPDDGRLTTLEAQQKSLGDNLADLTRRVDDLAATAQTAQKAADAATAAADAAKTTLQSGVQPGAIDALTGRVAALEGAVKNLADAIAQHSASSDDRAMRLAIVAATLRAAVERGAPYQAELAAVQSLGAPPNATGPLQPFAASGVPSAAALGRELAALVPSLERAADTAPRETGFLGRLEANAQKLVRVTPIDAPPGNDPSAVIARIAIDAAHADLGAALADIALLPDAAKPLAADWTKKAQARDAALAAGRQIAADTLAALTKPAAQ